MLVLYLHPSSRKLVFQFLLVVHQLHQLAHHLHLFQLEQHLLLLPDFHILEAFVTQKPRRAVSKNVPVSEEVRLSPHVAEGGFGESVERSAGA